MAYIHMSMSWHAENTHNSNDILDHDEAVPHTAQTELSLKKNKKQSAHMHAETLDFHTC